MSRLQEKMNALTGGQSVSIKDVLRLPADAGGSTGGARQTDNEPRLYAKVSLG